MWHALSWIMHLVLYCWSGSQLQPAIRLKHGVIGGRVLRDVLEYVPSFSLLRKGVKPFCGGVTNMPFYLIFILDFSIYSPKCK